MVKFLVRVPNGIIVKKFKCKRSFSLKQFFVVVLSLAEIIFFTAAGMVLCFRSVAKKILQIKV